MSQTKKQEILLNIENRDTQRKQKHDQKPSKSHKSDYNTLLNQVDLITNFKELNNFEDDFKTSSADNNFSVGEISIIKRRIDDIKRIFHKVEVEKNKRKRARFTFKKRIEMDKIRIEKGITKGDSLKSHQLQTETDTDKENTKTLQNAKTKEDAETSNAITQPGNYTLPSNSDILIKNIHQENRSKIILENKANTVHIENCSNLDIECVCETSIFLDGFKNSSVRVKCQQLRMHSSLEVDVYVDCHSRSIIEDSTEIKFAPYDQNTKYENYSNIDDFNWLSKTEKSPNFTVEDA